jgi:putative ABC transport system substrate-binding protein
MNGTLLWLLTVLLLAFIHLAEAQQPAKVPRVGHLSVGPVSDPARREAFRQGLRELGYVEGR